jgi:hypothetical protein
MPRHNVTPAYPPADRYGYRPLAAPHDGVTFRIRGVSGIGHIYVEYRGLETDVIAAGIATAEFFTPQPGRGRDDAAGRSVWLRRRKDGVRIVTFLGDPFLQPCLPGITSELVSAALAEDERAHGTHEQICARARAVASQWVSPPEPTTLETYLKAAAAPIRNLVVIAGRFSPLLMDKVHRHLIQIEELIAAETQRMATRGSEPRRAPRPRPSFLKLVVDNGVPR